MRIVNRKAFLAMPPGTVYAEGQPFAFGHWEVKGDTCGPNDWFSADLSAYAIESTGSGDLRDKQEAMLADGASFPMDFDCIGRNGIYEDKSIFAILEPDDIRALIARLQQCLGA